MTTKQLVIGAAAFGVVYYFVKMRSITTKREWLLLNANSPVFNDMSSSEILDSYDYLVNYVQTGKLVPLSLGSRITNIMSKYNIQF